MNIEFLFIVEICIALILIFLFFFRRLDKKWFKEVGTTTFYGKKEDCKCYDCLTSGGKDCWANCLHPTGFEYNENPCMSCELRSWCYTKYE